MVLKKLAPKANAFDYTNSNNTNTNLRWTCIVKYAEGK